ncbi:MAG: hypothetical protein ACP5II_04815 [Infirmifilum sp.]|jgi:hypothetical protein|uniref:hypothetical protein n=1 Tax=Infirmifilum TaxID=2856573 RepID=UPI00235361E3
MQHVVPAVGIRVEDEESLGKLPNRLSRFETSHVWVQLISSYKFFSDMGVSDITDVFIDHDVNIASLKFESVGEIDQEVFEKIITIADETKGRTIIISRPLSLSSTTLERIYELAAMYKVKILLEPEKPENLKQISSIIGSFMGGILGLSLVQEKYSSTETFISSIRGYLQVARNIEISNYDGTEPAPILIPSQYNNPMLLRFLMRNQFEGFLTICYSKRMTDDTWLLRELFSLKEQLATLSEKED